MRETPAPLGRDERRTLETGKEVTRQADGATFVVEDGDTRLELDQREVRTIYHLTDGGPDDRPSPPAPERTARTGSGDDPTGSSDESIPTGDPAVRTTDPGSLYADPEADRVVRFSDPDAWDGYRVEVWQYESGDVTNCVDHWTDETIDEFAASEGTEYLGGHCTDDCGPYGVYTAAATGHRCEICDRPMEQGLYQGTEQSYPGLVCADYDAPDDCAGHEKVTSLTLSGAYVLVDDYVERRFG